MVPARVRMERDPVERASVVTAIEVCASEHGGAGLGLLTMARKSAKPIVVRTARLCSLAAFLIMEVRIPA